MNKTRAAATIATLAASIGLAGAIACGSGGGDTGVPYATSSTTQPAASASAAPAAKKATTKPVSVEQANAAKSAESYLSGNSSFSRKGLIGQLKYEGFSVKAATAAVDSLHVDWNEQAALSAQSYLDMGGFSRKSLIGQLKYEGFTQSQAEYGVKKAGL